MNIHEEISPKGMLKLMLEAANIKMNDNNEISFENIIEDIVCACSVITDKNSTQTERRQQLSFISKIVTVANHWNE